MSVMRPQTFDELTGCNREKALLKVAIASAKARNDSMPHILITGGPGLGKTAIANVIANELGVEFKAFLANAFESKKDIQNLLSTMNNEGYERYGEINGIIRPTVIFLDEIHKMSKSLQECLFTAMEDFSFTEEQKHTYNGTNIQKTAWIPRFTLIGATTKTGELDKAFIERFKIQIHLDYYSEAQLVEMMELYCNKINLNYDLDGLIEIAKRSRGIARRAINFVDRCRDYMIAFNGSKITTEIVINNFKMIGIDIIGLDEVDISILKYLYKSYPEKMSINRLAGILNNTENALKENNEPYLIKMGLIEATPKGRIISDKGREYCEKNRLVDDPPQDNNNRRIISRA